MALGRAQCVWFDKGNAVGIYPSRCALAKWHFRGAREVGEESNVHRYWRKHTDLLRVANSFLRGWKPCEREAHRKASYLCLNDLLLGRTLPRVPSGPFKQTSNPKHRYEFVQRIIDAFWRKWTRDFFPSLIVSQRWHTARRNVLVGDVVLIQDANQVRGNWKLGIVSGTTQRMTERCEKWR